MSALDSLFDSPPGPSRPPPPPRAYSPTPSPSPPRRRRSSQPLFLSPNDNGNGSETPARAPGRRLDLDLDGGVDRALDLGPEIDPFDVPPAAGAGAGVYDPLAIGGMSNGIGEEDDDTGKKKRKPIPKIDADRLMSPYGLPALMKEAKRFKVRGKGHEAQDLKALLGVYQLWAHQMFPRGDFMGTVTRVENVLRTRRMENAMKGYRDAFYPPPLELERDLDQDQDQSLDLGQDIDMAEFDIDVDMENETENGIGNRTGGPSHRRSSEPLFEAHEDEDVDLDELAAMEEMEREQAGVPTASRTNGDGGGTTQGGDGPPDLAEEDDWEGLYD